MLGALGVAAGGPVRAQERPEGLFVGPWILAPSLSYDLESYSNLLRTPDNRDPVQDTGSTLGATLAARLPFHQSELSFNYEASRFDYRDTRFSEDTAQTLSVGLDLRFAHGDRLRLSDRFTRDVIQIRDEFTADTPEEVFQGEPFHLNRWEIDLDRSEPNQRGYRIRISRRDYNYEGQSRVSLYDYRGFDNIFEYRHPVPGGHWIVAHYNPRRMNHYSPQDPVGVPFRKEINDTVQLGLEGRVGGGQSYLFRVGGDRLRLPPDSREFTTWSGQFLGRAQLGGRSQLQLLLQRRTLPSNSGSHYTTTEVRARFQQTWTAGPGFEAGVSAARNDYGTTEQVGCNGVRRRDERYQGEGTFSWTIHRRLAFEVGATHDLRSSNCEFGNYSATEVRAGIELGWF